jgi:hypothetical protein
MWAKKPRKPIVIPNGLGLLVATMGVCDNDVTELENQHD